MIYDDETGIGEKAIETTLGSGATSVPTVGAVKTGLDGKQDTITGTAGYVMTGTGNAGDVGERAIYGTAVYSNSLVTAETVNTSVTNAVNSSLIRVDENGAPSDTGTLWEINTDVFALGVLPSGYTQLEWIESTGTQYIDTGITGYTRWIGSGKATTDKTKSQVLLAGSTVGYAGTFVGSVSDKNKWTTWSVDDTDYPITTAQEFDLTWTDTGVHGIIGATNINHEYNSSGGISGTWKICWPSSQYPFAGELYYFRAYQNDILVRNFIPARNSSGVVGMYDTVSGQFFTNQGMGEFIAGPDLRR